MVTILKRREPSTTPRILDGVRDAIQIWQCHHNGGTSGNMLIWIIYRQYLHIGQIDCLFKQLRRTNSLLPQIKCQNTTYALSLAQPASSFSCEFCMGRSSAYLVGDFSPYDEMLLRPFWCQTTEKRRVLTFVNLALHKWYPSSHVRKQPKMEVPPHLKWR